MKAYRCSRELIEAAGTAVKGSPVEVEEGSGMLVSVAVDEGVDPPWNAKEDSRSDAEMVDA